MTMKNIFSWVNLHFQKCNIEKLRLITNTQAHSDEKKGEWVMHVVSMCNFLGYMRWHLIWMTWQMIFWEPKKHIISTPREKRLLRQILYWWVNNKQLPTYICFAISSDHCTLIPAKSLAWHPASYNPTGKPCQPMSAVPAPCSASPKRDNKDKSSSQPTTKPSSQHWKGACQTYFLIIVLTDSQRGSGPEALSRA